MAKFKLKINRFLETNNFIYAFTIATVFGGAVFISIVEKMKFVDALWWSFVTTTTVGYGDISPTTSLGRIIAVVLMIVGIGFIGMLTGTIATFFIKNKEKNLTYREGIIEDIKNKLDDFDSLTREDLTDMFNVLERLKE